MEGGEGKKERNLFSSFIFRLTAVIRIHFLKFVIIHSNGSCIVCLGKIWKQVSNVYFMLSF